MAKVTIIKTNTGTRLIGATQCSNGAYWNADGCFKYCNNNDTDSMKKHQASKLLKCTIPLGNECSDETRWWENRNNFIDAEINYDVTQTYKSS